MTSLTPKILKTSLSKTFLSFLYVSPHQKDDSSPFLPLITNLIFFNSFSIKFTKTFACNKYFLEHNHDLFNSLLVNFITVFFGC